MFYSKYFWLKWETTKAWLRYIFLRNYSAVRIEDIVIIGVVLSKKIGQSKPVTFMPTYVL